MLWDTLPHAVSWTGMESVGQGKRAGCGICRWCGKRIGRRGTLVQTDGWIGYDRLPTLGYRHNPLAIKGDPDLLASHLPMVHIVFSNLKTWLLGTHHGVSPQHLQAYLNEFVFRFNRRFYPMTSFVKVLGIGSHTIGPTYGGLYQGTWVHPNPDLGALGFDVLPDGEPYWGLPELYM